MQVLVIDFMDGTQQRFELGPKEQMTKFFVDDHQMLLVFGRRLATNEQFRLHNFPTKHVKHFVGVNEEG
jgi:hypothetical protein